VQALLPDLDLGPLPPSEDPPPSASRRSASRFALPIQIAGLLAGCWMLFFTTMSRHLHRFTWGGLIGHAVRYAFLTWLWSAAVTFLLYLTLPADERRNAAWRTLRTSSAAVWFAPAILLLADFSPAALAAGLVLVAKATRLLYSEWRETHPAPAPLGVMPALEGIFTDYSLPRQGFGRELLPALICAALTQLGTVELGMHKPFAAAALLVAGMSTLTIQALSRGAWAEERPTSLPRSFLGALLTILLAAGLTATGLRGHLIPGGSGSGGTSASIRDLFRELIGRDTGGGALDDAVKDAKAKGGGNSDAPPPQPVPMQEMAPGGNFLGVILRPEVQPVVTLVAPLPAVRSGFPSATPAHPFSIPFGGEYWMYRWLTYNNRPPPNSFLQRGTPAELSFRTVDHWPLQMEARQKLIQPIDLACCAKVQMEILNADKNAAVIQLELVAIGERGAEQSLGAAPINSRPDASQDPVKPVGETLDYVVPPALGIGIVEEFKVVFRRARVQSDHSARIAISRFLLVPHG